MDDITRSVVWCPRCGGKHRGMEFQLLANAIYAPGRDTGDPDGLAATHWAICPKNNEPVLLLETADKVVIEGEDS